MEKKSPSSCDTVRTFAYWLKIGKCRIKKHQQYCLYVLICSCWLLIRKRTACIKSSNCCAAFGLTDTNQIRAVLLTYVQYCSQSAFFLEGKDSELSFLSSRLEAALEDFYWNPGRFSFRWCLVILFCFAPFSLSGCLKMFHFLAQLILKRERVSERKRVSVCVCVWVWVCVWERERERELRNNGM